MIAALFDVLVISTGPKFSYNLGHNILELDNVLVHIRLTTSKVKPDI